MKKVIKCILIILIIILLILILKSTYSKYTSKTEGNVYSEIGQWVIKVNNSDITKPDDTDPEKPITFVIDKVENFRWDWESHPNVEKGKIAPGMTGEFYITIDPTGTDTSFDYTVSIDVSELEQTNLKITEISLADGKNFDNKDKLTTDDKDENQIYTCIKRKLLSEIQSENPTDTIVVKMEWTEDDDKIDTELGKNAYGVNDISIPVTVNAIQYTGE